MEASWADPRSLLITVAPLCTSATTCCGTQAAAPEPSPVHGLRAHTGAWAPSEHRWVSGVAYVHFADEDTNWSKSVKPKLEARVFKFLMQHHG